MSSEADMHIRLRWITRDRDRHGTVRVYYRRPGRRKIRMRSEPGSIAFAEHYAELDAMFASGEFAKPAASNPFAPGTLGWLIKLYRASSPWAALDPSTKRARGRVIDHMLDEPVVRGEPEIYAAFPLPRLTLAALEVLRDRKAKLPGAANERVKALRSLFKWALAQKAVTGVASNPALGLHKIKYATNGHHTWSIEEIEQYEARHPAGTKAHMALQILLYTGARRSDAPRLGRQHVRNGALIWTAHKNRNRHPVTIEIPVLQPLADALAAGPVSDLVFLVTENGRPFSINGFGNWFKERCVEAGLPHCSAHGMRKASATRAAESGATAHQLMAMFGWSNLAEAERYTQAAKRKRMAAAGMQHLLLRPKMSHQSTPVGQLKEKIK